MSELNPPEGATIEPDKGAVLSAIYRALSLHYGPQKWWPTRSGSPWEIMMGAVLTQRTSWRNVDLAFDNIERLWGLRGLSEPQVVLDATTDTLITVLKPTGHYASKPRKLQGLAHAVLEAGGTEAVVASRDPTEHLRRWLLSLWGIGPETADAILLYAMHRPVFVADAYALRLAIRWGLLQPGANYEEIQRLFTENLPEDEALFNEYHALIVAHGKDICRPHPRCEVCLLNRRLAVSVAEEVAWSWCCPRLFISS